MCLDPIILFFLAGIIAKFIWPKIKLPKLVYTIISSFLLISIGLKGGLELCTWASWQLGMQAFAIIGLSIVTCLVSLSMLNAFKTYTRAESIVIAAHYGSVSVGTFAIAIAALEYAHIDSEAYMPLFVALMESPAIILASLLLKRIYHSSSSVMSNVWNAINCKSIYILMGSIIFGYFAGPALLPIIKLIFFDPFKIVLALFLFEMGILVGLQFDMIKKHTRTIMLQAVTLSLSCACIGLVMGLLIKLSLGGTILLMVLASSASYIAVPASLRQSYPESNVPLALSYSLGVTFPFNVFFGIYLYTYVATVLFNYFGLPTAVPLCPI